MKIEMTVEQAEIVLMALQTEKVKVKEAYATTVPEEKILRRKMTNLTTQIAALETMIEQDIKAYGLV